MTNEEIKKECEEMYAQIKQAETRLMEIRKICPHEHTFIGNYSWRPGAVDRCNICSYCGEPIYEFPVITGSKKGE